MSGWRHNGSTTERGYGWQWQKLRKQILQRDRYLCQHCWRANPPRITQAKEVDHIKPKAKGGTDDPSNLEAICTPCHRAKSARDQGKELKPKRATGWDGWPE